MRWRWSRPSGEPAPGTARRVGFTLLEVLVAVVILAVALTALLSTQGGAVRLRTEADALTLGSFLLQAQMTEIELAGFPAEVGTREGDFGADYPGYRWEATVADLPIPALPAGMVREVRLAVTWPSGRGVERLELTHVVRDPKAAAAKAGGGPGPGPSPTPTASPR